MLAAVKWGKTPVPMLMLLRRGAALALLAGAAACAPAPAPAEVVLPTLASPLDTPVPTATFTATPSTTPSATPTATATASVTPSPTPVPTSAFAALGAVQPAAAPGSTTVQGTLADGEVHIIPLADVTGLAQITLRADDPATLDPSLSLLRPIGLAHALDDNAGGADGAAQLLFTTPLTAFDDAPGPWGVQVQGAGRGAYTLTFVFQGTLVSSTSAPLRTPPPTATVPPLTPPPLVAAPDARLERGVSAQGELARSGGFVRHLIAPQAGDVITVRARGLGDFVPRLELYGPDGALLASAGGRTTPDATATITGVTATRGDVLVLFVSADAPGVGAYQVGWNTDGVAEVVRRAVIAPGETLFGVLRPATQDLYYVRLRAGDIVRAVARTSSPGLVPIASAFAPDGTSVALGAPDSASEVAFRAETSGVYALGVQGVAATSGGDYALTLTLDAPGPDDTEPPVVLVLDLAGDLPPGGSVDVPFPLAAGQFAVVALDAAANSPLDPILTVLGPGGAVVAENDDSDGTLNARVAFRAAQTGGYVLRVRGYNSGGAFRLRGWVAVD